MSNNTTMLTGKTKYFKNRHLESLGTILDSSIKSVGLDFKLKQYRAISDWADIVGEDIADVSKPIDFKFKVLFVNVESNVWLQQLSFFEEMIVGKINDYIKLRVVDKIYFRLGSITLDS